jgi:CBS domain-containing protein
MGKKVRELMATSPVCLSASASIKKAADAMRTHNIGDVIVTREDGTLYGIATDRDLVVRAISEGAAPDEVTLGEICSPHVSVISPEGSAKDAVAMMRKEALRRLVVVDGDRPVGILSLGDLAMERDPDSALADISLADPNS